MRTWVWVLGLVAAFFLAAWLAGPDRLNALADRLDAASAALQR